MKDELEKNLSETFILLYKETNYLAVGDGWYDIIYELSEVLEKEIIKLLIQNPDATKPVIRQVKEKFGGLRWYMDGTNQVMRDAIRKAEEKSYKTCEECGAPGTRRNGGWILTLCDDCNSKGKDDDII
jgi:hypothetical protein